MKSLILRVSLGLFAVTFVTVDANARSFRNLQIPNGERMDCIGCHTTNTGGARNAFGMQVGNMGLNGDDVVWADVCALDADGDGYTNGAELGDPNCTWTIGSANPSFAPTNPGLGNMTPCGNGTLEGPEECDGTGNLNGMTCVDLELPDGRLDCNTNCTFKTDECVVANPNNQPGTNNEPGTNNQTGGTNNQTGGTNNETTTNNTTTPEPTSPTDPNSAEGDGDIEPFFCDGEMNVDDERPASALIIFALLGLLGLRQTRD